MSVKSAKIEAPTWTLIVAVYGGWITVTGFSGDMPWWLLLPLGGWFSAWYYSLQHEVIHGHPTGSRWFNDLLGYAPLGLFIPYAIYRSDHIRHHRPEFLTIPGEDPESFYFDAQTWGRMPGMLKVLNIVNNSLFGRLTVGVVIIITRFWLGEFRRLAHGDLANLGHWIMHAALVAGVLYWVSVICGLPVWLYVLTFAYPGLALTLMRSYIEHRAAVAPAQRTAIVESNFVLGLLYLNNNLHAAHHDAPSLPWYQLPAYYRSKKDHFLAENGGFHFTGYGNVIGKFMFAPIDAPVLPKQ